MEIGHTTEAALLEALRMRVCQMIPGAFTRVNTWIDDEPLPKDDPKDIMWGCSFCTGESTFDVLSHNICNTSEMMTAVVTPMLRLTQESPPMLDEPILRATRPFSMLGIKQALLSAILKESPDTHAAWQPTDAEGRWLLLEQIAPISCTSTRRAETWPFLFMSLSFQMHFIWSL